MLFSKGCCVHYLTTRFGEKLDLGFFKKLDTIHDE